MDAQQAIAIWAGSLMGIAPATIGDVQFEGFYDGPGCPSCDYGAVTGINISAYQGDGKYLASKQLTATISFVDILRGIIEAGRDGG